MTREEINEDKQKKISRENNIENTKKIVLKIFKYTFWIILFVSLFLSYTTYVSTVKIKVREYRIIQPKIPDTFEGVKLLHFSDLHYGGTMVEDHVAQLKELVNVRKPDMIAFTGDLIIPDYSLSNDEKDKLIDLLKGMTASLGKYAILGDEDTDTAKTILESAGFIILDNQFDLIYNESQMPIMIIGISSTINGKDNVEQAYQYFSLENHNDNLFTVTLIHEPDLTDTIVEHYPSTDMILAGHSHNGTVRIPNTNISLERKNGARKYHQDYYQINDTKLYISGGLGTSNSMPIRLFCRPSFNLYRLSSK